MTISVVIPCYNAAPFLSQSLDSVFQQTLQPLEVIVVDDGSTDASMSVAESSGYPLQIIRQRNQGPSIARNVGTVASRGDYLMYLDADDMLAPKSLELLAAAVDGRPNCVAVMSCAVFQDDPSRPTAVLDQPYQSFFPHILTANMRNPICWLTSREHFDRVGGFAEGIRIFEDWDFWAQIALTGAELICVPYVGGLYRRHSAATLMTVVVQKRAIGHVHVMQRLTAGMLAQPQLVKKWGDTLFWSAWTALLRARQAGLPWEELAPLAGLLKEVARLGPPELRRSRYGRLVRLFGYRWVEQVRQWCLPGSTGTAAPPALADNP